MYLFANRLSSGSSRRRSRRVRFGAKAAVAGFAALVFMSAASAGATGSTFRTVVRGLDNPRGLAFLPGGRLAVAEGGHAGSLCSAPGQCVGLSGRVTAVNLQSGRRTTLAAGFPSIGGPFAPFGLGGLAMQKGKLFAIVGVNPQALGSPAVACKGAPDVASCVATSTKVVREVGNLDQLRSLRANHGWRIIAGVGRFDFDYAASHPDPGNTDYAPGDGDPFGLIAAPAGGFYVVDGASNTLGLVTARGRISVLAFVPDPPNHKPIYDAAPTCAAGTPDGSTIIGTESGALWRWKSRHLTRLLLGGKVEQVVSCVADDRGDVYLGNLDARIINFVGAPSTGSIVKMSPDLRTSYVARGLNYPTGMTWGPDRKLYVTNNGLCPTNLSLIDPQMTPPAGACHASGQVVRLVGVTR